MILNRFFSPKTQQEDTVTLNDISVEGRARLLDMAYSRLKFGLFAMPIVSGVFVWYYHHQHSADYRIMVWSLCYFLAAVATIFLNDIYKKSQENESADYMLKVWLPRVEKIAILHGIGLLVLLPMVSNTATIEFKYLFILTLAAIMAGNATHQAPMLSVFNRFLIVGWHGTVLLMPWSFYNHWQFIMPLSAIYSVGMYRHALTSHRFFVRMIWLEEEGARLAASYKSAKESAEAALQAKNQFLTTASHDLRQPIHAMGFLIEAIGLRNKDSLLTPPLNDLKQSVRSVTQMFNALLDLSKIESGAIKIQSSNIPLKNLIKEIVMIYGEEAKTKNLRLSVRLPKNAVIAKCDGMLLRQSIINLMNNALRYTRQGGVLIAVRKIASDWQIEVWDTGIGVAIADKARIFSPFFRHEHAWRIDNAGHGLGLSVVARACELMGCQYGFQSQLNRGSRFWIRIPAVSGKLESIAILNQVMPGKQEAQGKALSGKCLIVDDDPHVAQAWQVLLASWGLQAACAESSAQAFALLDQGFEPQVILCDQRLRAGESGYEVLCSLLSRCPEARGAMVSGEYKSPELIRAENDGYIVLRKPLEPEILHTLLTRWLTN